MFWAVNEAWRFCFRGSVLSTKGQLFELLEYVEKGVAASRRSQFVPLADEDALLNSHSYQ